MHTNVKDPVESREATIRKIEELVRAREREDPLALLESGTSGITLVEAQRQAMLRRLDDDPSYQPPRHWYSDSFGKRNNLPVD